MRIWRDLPGREFIEALISSNVENMVKTSKFRAKYRYDDKTQAILESITAYHGIQKDKLALFPAREGTLNLIEAQCEEIIRNQNLVKQGHRNIMFTRGAGLGSYIHSIKRRAAAKKEYIKIIREYYQANHDEVLDPQALIAKATAAQVKIGKNIGMAAGPRMEAIDPIHRPWEIEMKDGHLRDVGWTTHGDYLLEWFELVTSGQYSEPFFVYLESTEHCLTRDTAKRSGIVMFRTGNTPAPFYMIRPQGNLLQMGEMTSLDVNNINWRAFDTTWVTQAISVKGMSSGPMPTLAYNWTTQKELICGAHNAADEGHYGKKYIDVHHSSFTGGQMLRCAGMIGAVNGKVAYVDNCSGHYKPGHENIYSFVKHMYKRGYFSDDAVISDMSLDDTCLASKPEGLPVKMYIMNPYAKSLWTTGRKGALR